jgi:flagellar motor switch/type III secretory pathway protein FliN
MSSSRSLLSLAESAISARPLRSRRAADAADLDRSVRAVARQWHEAWGLPWPDVDAQSTALPDLPPCQALSEALAKPEIAALRWQPVTAQDPVELWWALLHSHDRASLPAALLVEALFQAPPASFTRMATLPRQGMAEQVAETAWRDWQARLEVLFAMQPAFEDPSGSVRPGELPREVSLPWSGAAAIALPWCGQVLMLAASDGLLRRRAEGQGTASSLSTGSHRIGPSDPAGARALVRPLQALSAQRVRLDVLLAATEVDLGMLTGLQVGDILRTVHPLDEPLIVNIAGTDPQAGTRLCGGFLGQQSGGRAVELVRQVKR